MVRWRLTIVASVFPPVAGANETQEPIWQSDGLLQYLKDTGADALINVGPMSRVQRPNSRVLIARTLPLMA